MMGFQFECSKMSSIWPISGTMEKGKLTQPKTRRDKQLV